METDKKQERELLGLGKDRHLCLIVASPQDNAYVSFEYTLLSLSLCLTQTHTHTHEDDSVLRQCDNMLVGHNVPCTAGRSVSL